MIAEPLADRRAHLQKRVEALAHERHADVGDDVAAGDARALDADEVESHALAPARDGDAGAVRLDAAHPAAVAAGKHAHLGAGRDRARDRRARDHDAVAFQHEGAIDRQAEKPTGSRARSSVAS